MDWFWFDGLLLCALHHLLALDGIVGAAQSFAQFHQRRCVGAGGEVIRRQLMKKIASFLIAATALVGFAGLAHAEDEKNAKPIGY